MVFHPCFAIEEFKRIQRELLTGLRAESVEPGIIAQRHFYVALAGRQHPAGRFHTEKTVGGIRLNDINAFYKSNIVPHGSIIAIAGKFDPSVFMQKYRTRLEQWSGTDTAMMTPAVSVPVADPVYRLIDKPDLTQATVMIGHAAPGERDQERNCIALANYILGGGNFSSRLMTRIRSRDGKTYGINSQIVALHHFGFFSISTSTQNGQIAEVIRGIIDTLRDLVNSGVTSEELDKARKFAIGNLAFQLEGVGNVAEKLLWLRLYGRAESYVEQFDTMLNEITVESVNRSACRVFNPDKLSIIIVGRKTEIQQQIKSIGDFSSFHFRDMV
jgi:zinc protease